MKERSIDENKHRRVVNSEMESIVVVSRGGAGGWGLVLIGDRISVGEDEKVQKMDSGDGCITL